MNIFKKLINWLIKKLGGYTEEELIVEVDKGVKVCNDDANNAIELATYWHQRFLNEHEKYKAEHENYLALLNCHNATASAQSKTQGVSGAIDTIKAYCKSKGNCNECALYNETGGCKIHEIPCYWGG